jgi:UDP-N-acetyl-D-mannosaminuronic acid dehydrogenase
VAHCPERVLPGRILEELVGNDRVVGGDDSASTEIAVKFYRSFVQGEVCATNARTAELVKLTENAFRDVNIAFANELSLICAELEINVWDAIRFANLHPRVNILQPGPGVGGHCIAVDPWFIVASSPNTARLIRTAREVNDSKPEWVIQEVRTQANRFKKPRVACLGLAFKADIDDLRESPALYIVEQLAQSEGMELFVVEPYIKELPASLALFSSVQLMGLKNALLNSDIVLILVEHRQFKDIDSSSLMAKFVIDTKGLIHNKQRLKG